MARKISRLPADIGGNIAIEFALVAPVFILMIVGLADYGLATRERAVLDAAARAGLQALLFNSANIGGAEAAATAMAPAAVVTTSIVCTCDSGVGVSCSGTCPTGLPRRSGRVDVSHDHTLLLNWPGFPDPVVLTATAAGRLR